MSTLTFNGTDLADFGVHISGEGTYNAPSRAVEEQIVPGRNGTLIIDGGRWENIIVTYPAYITDDFDDNMAALRSFLASVRGYARLADTYHPNEFRLACFSDEITVRTSGRYNAQGQFDLSFNCKPQRFLTSGEEVTTFDASDLPSESFSGNPATFETDGEYKVSELSVGITPVQDLHGQANPYPPGGGKNLIPYPYTSQAGTYNGVTVTVNADGTLVLNGTATATVFWNLKSDADAVPMTAGDYILHKPSTTTVSGLSIVAVKDGAFWKAASQANASLTLESDANVSWYVKVDSGTALSNVKVYPMFEKGTTASDWSPYSNICPISGRTGMTVTRAGKNLLDLSGHLRANSNGLTFTPDASDGNKVAISGTASSTWSSLLSSQIPIALKAGRTYTFSVGRTIPNSAFIRIVNTDGTNTARVIPANSDHITWTQTADGTTVSEIVLQNLTSGSTVNYTLSFMVEEGASATDYTPYAGQTYPITWETEAGTVYGGTLDVVSGVLTVNTILATVSSFLAENANWSNSSTIVVSSGLTLTEPRDGQKRDKAVTNMLPNAMGYGIDTAVGGASITTPCFGFNENDAYSKYIYARFPKTIGTTLAEINTYLAENPLTIAYAIQTPQTYQLTPTEVKTLLGGNTIYTDAGAVDGKYLLPLQMVNPTRFAAKPIIRIYGAGTVGIGDVNVTFDGSSEYVDLDCELQDAYYGPANKNSSVTLDPNRFPVIPASGAGIVLGGGITQVDITPRWFEL